MMLEQADQYLGWAAPVGALILLLLNLRKLGKLVVAGYTRASTFMFGLFSMTTKMDALHSQVQLIANQLVPNGGSSIKDALNRIENRQTLSDQRIKVLMSDTSNAIVEYDKDGVCTWVNWQYCRLTGRTPMEVLGYGWINSIHPEDRDDVRREWERSVEESRSFEMSYRKMTHDGEIVPVTVRSHVMLGAKQEVVGFIKVVTRTV